MVLAINVPTNAIIIMVKVERDVASPPAGIKKSIAKYTIKAASVPAIPPVIPLKSRSKNKVKVSGLFSIMIFYFLGFISAVRNSPINLIVIPTSAILNTGIGFKTIKSIT